MTEKYKIIKTLRENNDQFSLQIAEKDGARYLLFFCGDNKIGKLFCGEKDDLSYIVLNVASLMFDTIEIPDVLRAARTVDFAAELET